MNFQSPAALLWLLPLLGAIILLYLLKMRRRDVRVPATFLWPTITADVRANAPFQKLRISLLLILQLLAMALVIFAVADPLRQAKGLHGRATVVVLDASASMGATDVSPSRFEAARQRIASIVGSMGLADRLALIESGSATRVIFPLSNGKPQMLRALRGIHQTDAVGDMSEAMRLAAALVGQRPGGRIVVLSDGSFPPVSDFSAGKAEVVFERVGTSGRNLAITALDSSPTPGGARQIFAGVRNESQSPMHAMLTFTVDGHVADAREVDVPARQTLGQTLRVAATAQRADVSFAATDDALKADNHAALFLQGAGSIRTLLVTSGNLFLERSLALEPNVRLDKALTVPDDEKAEVKGESHYDLVIFDGLPPVKVKASAVWSLGEPSPDFAVTDAGPLQRPRIVTWKRDDPVLNHVDLNDILIEKARKVTPMPEGRVLATGSDGPLMVASEHNGQRRLYLSWHVLDSDFPLHVAFPILVSNAVTWLTGQGRVGAGGGLNVRAGQPFSVAAQGNARTLSLLKPDGDRVDLDASTGLAVVRAADLVGDYVLTGPQTRTGIAANLLSETESDIAPRATLDLSGHAIAAHGASIVLAEIWRPIVLFVLLILGVEWWVFVRKS